MRHSDEESVKDMRELPEVETTRRDLDKDIAGRKVKAVEVTSLKTLPRIRTKKAFTEPLEGRKIVSVRRRGLHLLFDIEEDDRLVVDLGVSGTLRRHATKDKVEPHTHVVITFTQGGQLRWVDPSESGEIFLSRVDTLDEDIPALTSLGFDPVEEPISWTRFGQMVLSRHEQLKTLITDPAFVVGIGPLYSDEILHEALLRGDRRADELTIQEVRRLYRAIVETMHNALKYRATSLGEHPWLDIRGEPGGYNDYVEVWERAGEPSRNGRGTVAKMKVGGATHFHADNQV